MTEKIKSLCRYLSYVRRAKHSGGHGVHSPFTFDLILNVLEEENPYYHYEGLEMMRKSEKAKNASLQKRKYDQAAFRVLNVMRPEATIEFGFSNLITSGYLQSWHRKKAYFCIEDSFTEKAAQKLTSLDGLGCAYFHTAQTGKDTMALFELCLKKASKEAVFIFERIYDSDEVFALWKALIAKKEVRVSVNMYGLGLIFTNPELQKQDYTYLF